MQRILSMEVKLNGSKIKLVKGVKLYCASHGVGEVMSIETKEYFGEKLTLCEMNFEKEDIKILIPVNKMSEMGIRTIISKDMALKIKDSVLNEKAKKSNGIWTKRIVECETKVYSGSPLLIAEAIRDLFAGMKDMNKSYGERVLFEKAFDRFASEYSLALNITFEEAYKTIYDVLNSNYIMTHKENKDIEEKDTNEEDDFSDDDIEVEEDEEKEVETKRQKQKKTA